MTQESKQILSGLKQTNYGKALIELLDEEMAELTAVKNCTSWDDTLGRQYAERIINKVFSFMKDTPSVSTKTRYD